ncbi:MAG: metalloregulator ArsR/SmtB family transcription factor [Phycisphaerae bacterium]|nr:metalloregulator ArsR/SmtB family transcription factor [Phycisphaerae bacterium]
MSKKRPATPKLAARCGGPIDDLLNPELFKALGDPTRATLLACLAKCGRFCTVTEVAECCAVDLSVVSRHLALMERADVLESVKEGRMVRYRVRFHSLAVALHKLADAIEGCCPDKGAGNRRGGCCDK